MNQENSDPNWVGEDSIYRENILDHYKHPHNFGTLTKPTNKKREVNPVCGDEIEISLTLDNDAIKDIRFTGKGCAISIAATSMLTDAVRGKKQREVQQLTPSDTTNLLGIALGPVRIKCGTLGLRTLQEALTNGVHHERA